MESPGSAKRRTKIVCTLGPASSGEEVIRELILAGMNVARVNFAHGDHAGNGRIIARIRRAARGLDRQVAVLQDLQGIKMRTTALRGEPVELEAGRKTILDNRAVPSDEDRIGTTRPQILRNLRRGHRIVLGDGAITLLAERVGKEQARCRVEVGGTLRGRMGIHLPDTPPGDAPSLTAKDRRDLLFGLRSGVDLVALSYVRRAADVRALKRVIERCRRDTPVIAKIEKPQALDDLDAILEEVYGVMVARGDLGIELSPEAVPVAQKTIIEGAIRRRRPVITATQMLESMTHHPQPTRAEASDVANAVLDGTDAVMLSGETAIGAYPVGAVRMMDRIVRAAERYRFSRPRRPAGGTAAPGPAVDGVPHATVEAACAAAEVIGARYIIAFTSSGYTANLVAGRRLGTPAIALTPEPAVERRLALTWGVEAHGIQKASSIEAVLREVDGRLTKGGYAEPGETVVVVAGMPLRVHGVTNLIKLHRIGEAV